VAPRRPRLALALALLIPALAAPAADDPYGDPIPEGAKARLGTARLRGGYGTTPTAITPDGRFLVGGAGTGGVGYYDPATGKQTRTVRIEGAFGTPVAFSADGRRAVNPGYDNAIVWDTESGKVLAKVNRPSPGGDNGVSLSADGKRLAVGGTRREKEKGTTAVVWDVDGNKQLATVTPLQNNSVYVALSPDGSRLATWGFHYDQEAKEPPKPEADPGRTVQFWDAATGKETAKIRLTGGFNPSAVVFSPDGSLAAAAAGEGAVHLFDPATGTPKGLLLGRSRQGRKLAFSPDGKTLASGGDDGSIQRWAVADGRRLGTTECPVPIAYGPRAIQFTDNERVVAWGNRGQVTVVWEAPSGKLISPAGGHAGGITGAAVAGGGKEVLTAASDGAVIRWDPATGKERGTLGLKYPGGGYGAGGLVNGPVTLSADGTRALVSDGGSRGLGVYDLPAGTQQFVIPGDFNLESRGAFSTDGTKVVQVMTSYDVKKFPARVAVWDVAGGKKLGEVELSGVGYPSAAVSPDGKSLVTAGAKRDEKGGDGDFVVTGWELATGKKLGEFTEPAGFGVAYVATSGDNKSAVVATPRGPVAVIDFTTGKRERDLDLENRRPGAAPAVSPDGKSVAVVTVPNFGPNPASDVLVIDIASGKPKKTLSGVTGNPSVVVFSPDGKTLVTGSFDTTALVWDVGN
jgi:WD40 repeat protein